MVFSPAQASQGLERRTDFNSGVLEMSEKRECVCVGRGRGVEGRVIGKSVSLPSSPLSLMINSNIFKKGGLFNLEKTMVSVLNRELEYEVEKHKYKKLKIIQPRINFQLVNKPSRISPHEDL